MKRKLENEKTFYCLHDAGERDLEQILHNVFKIDLLPMIDYKERVEFRLNDSHFDKYKICFKVNHGELFFKRNTKMRLSNINNPIQSYDETISDWAPFSSFDISEFEKEILALYVKRSYKTIFKYADSKFKINLQKLSFVNDELTFCSEKSYLEIEFKKEYNRDLLALCNKLYNMDWEDLDITNSKIEASKTNCDCYQKRFHSLDMLEAYLYSILMQNSERLLGV